MPSADRGPRTARVLVTGATGMLGAAVLPALAAASYEVVAAGHRSGPVRLDVGRRTEVRELVRRIRPDVVVHLAGEADIERCERDEARAWRLNAGGTQHVADAARRHGARMVYVSTVEVFDGRKATAYTESDRPDPLNTYGMSKLAGERAVVAATADHLVVRAGWMFGGGPRDRGFVGRVLAQIDAGRRTVHAVGDKPGSPTYTRDLAAALVRLIRSGRRGLVHLASPGPASRFDVALHLLDRLSMAGTVDLVKVEAQFFRTEFHAPRPWQESLRSEVLTTPDLTPRHWRCGLDNYLRRRT